MRCPTQVPEVIGKPRSWDSIRSAGGTDSGGERIDFPIWSGLT